MSQMQQNKTPESIADLFFREEIPLSGGGKIVMGIFDPDFGNTLMRMQRQLAVSRSLSQFTFDPKKPFDQQKLPVRVTSDIDLLRSMFGYNDEQIVETLGLEYRLFHQEATHNALLISLLNDNFTASTIEGGVAVAFKDSVIEALSIPADYWENANQNNNEKRLLDGLPPNVEKNPKNIAEQKFALIDQLTQQEDKAVGDNQRSPSQIMLGRYIELLAHLGLFLRLGYERTDNFRTTPISDHGATSDSKSNGQRRLKRKRKTTD